MTASMLHDDALAMDAMDTGASSARKHEGTHVSVRDLAGLLQIECPEEAWLVRRVFAVRRLRAGESLLHAGDKFRSLYVVRAGCFKTVYTDLFGGEQVLGFPMRGEMMGADGVDSRHYRSTCTALNTSEVVIVPFASPSRLADECPKLVALLYPVVCRELVRVQNLAWTLGTLGADGRVVAFLLFWSARLGELGYSRRSFNLLMTRREIGNYLGLKLETVSRVLSALNNSGAIRVRMRNIDIVDADALYGVIDPTELSVAQAAANPGSSSVHADGNDGTRAGKPQFQPGLAWQPLAAA